MTGRSVNGVHGGEDLSQNERGKKSSRSSINMLPTHSEKSLTKLLPRTSLKTKTLKEYSVLLYQVETKYQVGSQQ